MKNVPIQILVLTLLAVLSAPAASWSQRPVSGRAQDPTSRRMLEEILAKEEEHADDMKNLLETIGKEERPREQ